MGFTLWQQRPFADLGVFQLDLVGTRTHHPLQQQRVVADMHPFQVAALEQDRQRLIGAQLATHRRGAEVAQQLAFDTDLQAGLLPQRHQRRAQRLARDIDAVARRLVIGQHRQRHCQPH